MLRKVLFRLQIVQVKHFLSSQSRQEFLIFLAWPHSIKTRELEVRACGTKDILSSYDVHTDGIKNGRSHKTGYKTSPDQVIELKLISCKVWLDNLRCQGDIGRANSFVGVLSRCLGFSGTSLSYIWLSLFLCDIAFDFCLCFFGDTG